ncbi:hypothetical protein QUF75_03845 [Desulfococcaceae bacterium HSG7]|nr:hypothetical protein [Desulfococcaceae bacterium HSG7]
MSCTVKITSIIIFLGSCIIVLGNFTDAINKIKLFYEQHIVINQPASTVKPEIKITPAIPPQATTTKEGGETIILHRVIINAPQDAKTSVDKKIRGHGNIEFQLIEGMHLITIETDTHIWSHSKQIDGEKFFNITSDKMKPKN